MTTEKMYLDAAERLLKWLDENPSEPFSVDRKWREQELASRLEIIADKAADEDDAAYQVGFDEGFDAGKDEMYSEIQDLEDEIEDLRAEIAELEDQAAEAFAQGYQSASQDNDVIEKLELS